MAQRINAAHGAPVVSAWDIDDLPEEDIYAATIYVDDLGALREAEDKLRRSREQWLEMVNYRSYKRGK